MLMGPYNWGGFYGGFHVGDAWTSTDFAETLAGVGVVESGTTKSTGFIGGGQVGFNLLPAPNFLLGIEADISGASLDGAVGTTPTIAGATSIATWTETVDTFGTVRGRLGLVANNWLLYGTGGFAWAEDSFSRLQSVNNVISPADGIFPTEGLLTSLSPTRTGWTAGGGIEWGFARNWTAKIEYLRLDLGGENFAFTAPFASGAAGASAFTINEGRLTIDTVRFGVNYLFN
jgi:outer membrane immunogenic protein